MNAIIDILLIEDNPADASLIEIYLKSSSLKYNFHHAETFFDGTLILKENDISIVLLDLTLPDSSGFKTLSKYLDTFPTVPVIVLTGIKNEIVENQAVKAGCQDFLVKGQFDGKLLGRSIRYSIQRFKTQIKLKQTALNLALSEKRFVEAQEMARFGNWEMDIVTNTMKWSDEIFRILGFQPNSFSPSLSIYLNYVHLEDKTLVESFFEDATKDGQLHKIEHRVLIQGSSIKHIALQAKVFFEEINNKIILVGAIQDITERKLSEQLIVEKNINKSTSKVKEEVLADMSFHIRTPLSSIVNLLFLLENTSASTQQKEYLEGLKISVDDLSIMINNLLNFSLLVSEKLKIEEEAFNIKDFIQSIKKIIQIKSDNALISIDFKIDENIPLKLISDQNKIAQIIYNLLDNCIKLSSTNNKIKVEINADQIVDDRLNLVLNISDLKSFLTKTDISKMLEADKFLETFNIEEEEKQQLGSAIVAKLVKTLNGNMEISSKENHGTTYTITIPVAISQQITLEYNGKPELPLKILLVEDHFLNQIATKKVLTTWSDFVTVDIAENGLVGYEKFIEHNYDLVLMDMQMPIMNGIDSAIKIRERSQVPIIALTANTSKQEADKCFEIGINEYIGKPFKPQDLYAKIMSLLATVVQ